MRLLLDTCTFLWILMDAPELSGKKGRFHRASARHSTVPADSIVLTIFTR